MVRSHGGASCSRGTGGRTVGRVERAESSRRIGPSDDNGLGRIFHRSGEAEAGEASVAIPVGFVSREETGNSDFEGLSDLAVEMSLERRAASLKRLLHVGRKRRGRGRKRGGGER